MDEINILAATAAAAPNHCDGDSPVVCILGVSSDFFLESFLRHVVISQSWQYSYCSCPWWAFWVECSSHVSVGHFILHIHLVLVNSCSGKDDTVLMVELQTKARIAEKEKAPPGLVESSYYSFHIYESIKTLC